MSTEKKDTHFVITYRDMKDGKIQELKARKIEDSSLGLSFIAIRDFIFDTSSMLLKPNEEHLEKKFQNIKCLHLSIYSVISIEEVGNDHQGLKFKKDKSNLVVLNAGSDNSGMKNQ